MGILKNLLLIFGLLFSPDLSEPLFIDNFKLTALIDTCPRYDYTQNVRLEIDRAKKELLRSLPNPLINSSFNLYLIPVVDSIRHDPNFYKTYVGVRFKNQSLYKVSELALRVSGRIKGHKVLYDLGYVDNSMIDSNYSDSSVLEIESGVSNKFCFLVKVPYQLLDQALEFNLSIDRVVILKDGQLIPVN